MQKFGSVLRWVGGYLRPYRARLATLIALSCAEVLLRILTPWPMKAVVDHVIGDAPMAAPVSGWLDAAPLPRTISDPRERLLFAIVAAGLLIQLAHQFAMMLHTRISVATGQGMVRDLQAELFAHLQRLALSHHTRMPPGDSLHRLESDARCLEHLILRAFFPIAFSLITLVAMFAVLASLDVPLAIVSLVVVPLLFGWLRLYGPRMRPAADRAKAMESRVLQRLHDNLRSIRLVKTYAREDTETERYGHVVDAALAAKVVMVRQESIFAVVVNSVTVAGTALVILVGGLSVLNGRISLGTLLLVIAYLGYVYGPLCGIANTTGALQQALASARRVRETLALIPEAQDAPGALDASNIRGDIAFEGVCFEYEAGVRVLDEVTFTVRAGERIALVGRSGAGKSTAIQLITRLYEPNRGRILIDGMDVRSYSLRSLRRRVAMVLQDAIVTSGTVRDNLRYGRPDASDAEVEAAARAAYAHEFIAEHAEGYDRDLGEAGGALSGGQRQRLNIARAFLTDAPILILDEPTSALDRLSESLVFDGLARLQRGRTTFVIAHRLSTVQNADRILVFDHGRIVASGTHEELLRTSELYAGLSGELSRPEELQAAS